MISDANINRTVDLGGYNPSILPQISVVFSYSKWLLRREVGIFSSNLFPWMLSTGGGRNFEECVTIGLFFPQICIIIEVNSTWSLCAIVFECGCHRLNE